MSRLSEQSSRLKAPTLDHPGGASAVGWLAGILSVGAGGYLLGISPAWSVPAPLLAELSGPLAWVATGGAWIGAGLVALGAATVLGGMSSRGSWTRRRTVLTVSSLLGVTLVVASQGQSLSLTPVRAASAKPPVAVPEVTPQPGDPAPSSEEPLEELEALLARLDARRGSENLRVVEALAQHGLGAVPGLRAYVLEPRAPGGPYAVYALTQVLLRKGPDPAGLEALLGCLDPSFPPAVQAQAATGLTLLGDPRTATCLVQHYRGQPELREALFAISGQQFRAGDEALAWLLDARSQGSLPDQLQAASQRGVDETTHDQIGQLLGLLDDSGNSLTSEQAIAELGGVGRAAIPGLIDLIERRVNGSGGAASALGRVLQSLPAEDRPLGALEVLVVSAGAESRFMLQLSALQSLYDLADPRTLRALIPHLDASASLARRTCQQVCELLTGQRFANRAAGEAWWAEHGESMGPQVGAR